jgi:hypothetical protein
MTAKEFAALIGLDTSLAAPAYEVFTEELAVPRKTRAARSADLADGLRRLGIPEDQVYLAVGELVRKSRR